MWTECSELLEQYVSLPVFMTHKLSVESIGEILQPFFKKQFVRILSSHSTSTETPMSVLIVFIAAWEFAYEVKLPGAPIQERRKAAACLRVDLSFRQTHLEVQHHEYIFKAATNWSHTGAIMVLVLCQNKYILHKYQNDHNFTLKWNNSDKWSNNWK